ncbi:MAG: PTS lactose/cellobiose transporter subunit IIA [Butyricicoccus sp.]
MDMESICFQIITSVGSAKSCFIEAIGLAKKGEFEGARRQIADGDQFFLEGHHAHADLIAQEADGNPVQMSLILTHAEDQLMSAETARIYALEFIELYEKLSAKGLL